MIKASLAVPRTRYEPFQPAQTSRPSATSATQRKLEHHKGWQNPTKSGLCGRWQFGEIGGQPTLGWSWMHYSPWTADRMRVQPCSTIIFLRKLPNWDDWVWAHSVHEVELYLNQATGCQGCSLPWQLSQQKNTHRKTSSNWNGTWLDLDRALPTRDVFF